MNMTATQPTEPINETVATTTAMSSVQLMLRLEGLTVLVAAIVAYAHIGASGWLFALLLLVPDFSALGFLVSKQVGTWSYNIVHWYALPVGLLALALAGGWTLGVQLALIWFAHIGMDRTVGYGLKYVAAFKDTHITRL